MLCYCVYKFESEAGPFCVTCCYVTDLGLYIEIISIPGLQLPRTIRYCVLLVRPPALPPQNYNPHHGNAAKNVSYAAEL